MQSVLKIWLVWIRSKTLDRSAEGEGEGDERGEAGGWMVDCHAVASEKGRAGIVMPMCSDREWGLECV